MILNNLSIFSTMARNFSSDAMNRGMIGYTIRRDFGPFTQREFDEYAEATCDDKSKYSLSGSPAPPFFFSKNLFPMYRKIVTHGDLKLDLLRMVQGYQGLNCLGSIVKGDIISVEMTIDNITETAAGEILRIATRGFRDGAVLFEGDSGFIVRRRRNEKRGNWRMEIVEPAAGQGSDEIKLLIKTETGQEKKYSRVSNDSNPMHTNRLFAKLAGLPGTMMHGVCVIAMCTNSLIESEAGGDNSKLRSVSGRFAYPAIPGDTLTLTGSRSRRGRFSEVHFNVCSSSGKTVLKKGYISLTG